MLNQMTIYEKNDLKSKTFDELWKNVWGGVNVSSQYKNEEIISREKFANLKNGVYFNDILFTLDDLIEESNKIQSWEETEWGFPKGRRNNKESDYDCALREFNEETGYKTKFLLNLQNVIPYEEIFTGSNYKSYKHKYFVMYMNYENSLIQTQFEKSEVSKMEWKNFENCMEAIRPYNIEKKRILHNIYNCIVENKII